MCTHQTISSDRLLELVNETCQGKQARFAQKTGIDRGLLNRYITGKQQLGAYNASKIARTFGVDEDWVLGVPDARKFAKGNVSVAESVSKAFLVASAYLEANAQAQYEVRKILGIM